MLYCSGMIAGEGLVGILLAVFALIPVGAKTLSEVIDLSGTLALPTIVANIGSLAVFAVIILFLLKFTLWRKRKK